MSMLVAMTGLNAAQADLAATSNNIANVGTIGFQRSRAEFGDMYTNSPYSSPRTQVGSGTQLSAVRQSFAQGAIESSDNMLDMALAGPGFFAMQTEKDGGQAIYSRAGAFSLDKEGYIVDNGGNYLLSYPVAQDGSLLSQSMKETRPLRVPMMSGVASPTQNVNISVNVSSSQTAIGQQSAVPPTVAFNPEDPTSYANKAPVTVLDSNGLPQDATVFFIKTEQPTATTTDTEYSVHLMIGSELLTPSDPAKIALRFDTFGFMYQGTDDIEFVGNSQTVNFNFTGSQMTKENFAVLQQVQDGETQNALTGLQVDEVGNIWASYSGQEAIALGMVGLANFTNPHGLRQIGNANYIVSPDSGPARVGQPGTGGFGSLRSGALENSNVDLTAELVNLITAQRNYQANAKAMETSQTLSQTILNMRT